MKVTTIQMAKHDGLKDSEIGKLPEGWEIKLITDLFNIETGTTPSTKQMSYWENGTLNWFTPADMSKLDGQIEIDESERKITEKALNEANLTLMPEGSILMSTRAPVGYISILKKKAAFNQGCKGLIPKNEKIVLSIFYAYYLISKKQFLNSLSGGSTFKELSKASLERLRLPLPPLPEQRAIASVLGTVDSAIQKANAAIEKTERLKRGLMQRLLTKGIGHRKFKDSEIGKIPEDWTVVRLRAALELCQYGLSVKMSETGKYPIIKMDDIINGMVVSYKVKYIDLGERTFKQFKLEKGDILFNRTNSYELVGRTGLFLLSGDYVFASYLIRLKPKKETVEPQFLTFYMIFSNDKIRQQLATRAVHQANINATNLQNFNIPLPPLPEQHRIAEILGTVDRKLELERARKGKLERLKGGLMADLLTGRKRIKMKENERR